MPSILGHSGSAPSPSISITRRPTLVRKHDEIPDQPSTEPLKRAKVTFSDDVEVNDVQEWEKAPDIVHEEVRRAIQMNGVGDTSGYDEVKSIYSVSARQERELSSCTLRNYTNALVGNIAALNRSCSSLISVVLRSDWLIQDGDYISTYARFLANLVSTHGTFLPDVLSMLVNNMTSCKNLSI